MYGRVSLKKQFSVMTMLLLTLLIVIELGANIWLYNFYTCDFENSEVFENLDKETKRSMCLANIGNAFATQSVSEELDATYAGRSRCGATTCDFTVPSNSIFVYVNADGFRGPEITKAKPQDTYRIFAIGGSTTYGSGVFNNQTWPFYLQEFYDETNLDFKVEVINAGWPFRMSIEETLLIKEDLLDYEPNLFVVFDGFNELWSEAKKNKNATPTKWKERWMEICELGNQEEFHTIITLQPIVNTGNKKLTLQEADSKVEQEKRKYSDYSVYFEKLNELKNHCTLTADLRGIFDTYEEPIYFDYVHTGYRGYQIIAENLYQISLPIVMKNSKNFVPNIDVQGTAATPANFVPDIDVEGTGATPPINEQLDSKNVESLSEQFLNSMIDIISLYKTPKVFSLIFE